MVNIVYIVEYSLTENLLVYTFFKFQNMSYQMAAFCPQGRTDFSQDLFRAI